MRPRDVRDYLRLHRLTRNPFDTLRSRKRQDRDHLVVLQNGGTLELRAERADFHMFHRIFLCDEYRLRRFSPGALDVVIDLGGNVGLFAARAATLAKRVISYEPIPQNFAQLTRNTAGYENVEAVRRAVAGSAGTRRIYHPREAALSGVYSAFPENGGHMSDAYDEVSAVSLADLIEAHAVERCDLLKLDVEGAEYEILYDAPGEILNKVRCIHAEYHDVGRSDPRTRIPELVAYLAAREFQVELYPHRRKENHGMLFATRPDAAPLSRA